MRLINTKAHGIIDYLICFVLITSPWSFNFSNIPEATFAIFTAGSIIFILAVFTRFELGLLKLVGLRLHLFVDFLVGILLASSPWIFNFDSVIFKPHFVFGLAIVFTSLLTDRVLYSKLSHELH